MLPPPVSRVSDASGVEFGKINLQTAKSPGIGQGLLAITLYRRYLQTTTTLRLL